ncbi:hypothetical protein THAOC_27291 [Thalassiosira oceanica]|uniref:EF-hand domain-containing protein n=1 Tax=Thalassiosira oceanica TaxID=159749 RepID=K0RHW5_THAOC|nr:hypothetical protein THAOC_27291 [Thalassiosira oceanica]|eukprot:EJK53298.1 hypothetical protein THAOC_27291 [Thalassiosira oceanica]
MKRKKAKYRRLFVERIAKEVELNRRGSVGPSEDELITAFKSVDTSDDGFIEKDELRAFLSNGKIEVDDKDFDALFASMDLKGRGRVNFLDFCAYLGSCDGGGLATEGSGEERVNAIVRQLEPGPDAAGVYTDSERSSVTKSAGCWSGLVMLTAE